jgi:hypothetical protein
MSAAKETLKEITQWPENSSPMLRVSINAGYEQATRSRTDEVVLQNLVSCYKSCCKWKSFRMSIKLLPALPFGADDVSQSMSG